MPKLTRKAWERAAFVALADQGVDGVRVERLAEQLGVTKGSFYWHFRNRRDLLDAMLVGWERWGTEQIIDGVEAAAGDPKERLRELIRTATRVTRARGDAGSDRVEAQMRAWAAADPAAAATIKRVDTRRVAFVVDLLVAYGIPRRRAELRAAALYRMMLGEFIWRTTGGVTGDQELLDEIVEMITGAAGRKR